LGQLFVGVFDVGIRPIFVIHIRQPMWRSAETPLSQGPTTKIESVTGRVRDRKMHFTRVELNTHWTSRAARLPFVSWSLHFTNLISKERVAALTSSALSLPVRA
jgi:hypothetical protein